MSDSSVLDENIRHAYLALEKLGYVVDGRQFESLIINSFDNSDNNDDSNKVEVDN